MVRYQLGDQGV